MAVKEFWECNRCGKHVEKPSNQPMTLMPNIPMSSITYTPILTQPILFQTKTQEYQYCDECTKIVEDFLAQRTHRIQDMEVKITVDNTQAIAAVKEVTTLLSDATTAAENLQKLRKKISRI